MNCSSQTNGAPYICSYAILILPLIKILVICLCNKLVLFFNLLEKKNYNTASLQLKLKVKLCQQSSYKKTNVCFPKRQTALCRQCVHMGTQRKITHLLELF